MSNQPESGLISKINLMILPSRRSIRLPNYDYSSNRAYFVTVCAKNRAMLFGDIVDGKMILNNFGEIVELVWESLPQHHQIELGSFQIMPNHIHMIIIIVGATRGSPDTEEGRSRPAPTELGTIVGLFKSECTKQIRSIAGNPIFDIWQRNYYEHVIRNQKDFDKISWYIENNPLMWDEDEDNITE